MFKNPFSFQGRIRRTEFGISYLLFLFCLFALVGIENYIKLNALSLVIHLIAIYWFLFSQGAKRCHDIGHSGFYQLIPFYIFAMIFVKGQNRRNKYGQDPKLVELQQRELALPATLRGIEFLEKKKIESDGSELLSGVLITGLSIALLSYFFDNNNWSYFIVESLMIMAGYFLILLFGFKRGETKSTNYSLFHRAMFSIGLYLCLWSYEVFSSTVVVDFNSAVIVENISNTIAIFTLTYLPLIISKKKKSKHTPPLEA